MGMRQPKIGLLCLYVKLYDDTVSWLRKDVEGFQSVIVKELQKENLTVLTHPICRIESEFTEAIAYFEEQKVDAVVTLHLAYSPSLESERVLKKTKLPLIVLNTTPDSSFNGTSGAGRIMQNHGIHGVQDMCSLLRRNNVQYQIYSGHYKNSGVIRNVALAAKGAMMAAEMRKCRVGRVGEPFVGMGDFRIPDDMLREALGAQVIDCNFAQIAALMKSISCEEIRKEWEKDCADFQCRELTYEVYAESARVNLAMRRWIEEERLDAVTVNFMATDNNPDLPQMPFIEMCKAMERGIGYAGEGDVLTAAFVSALMKGFPETTFAEMFCPDWDGNTVFLSHMGEYNLRVAADKPILTEMDFPYTSAKNPAALYGCFKEGRASFVNINPLPNGRFSLIAVRGEMMEMKETSEQFHKTVRGWFRPEAPLEEVLSEYSRYGGGHHGAIVYQAEAESLRCFANMMGWDFELI